MNRPGASAAGNDAASGPLVDWLIGQGLLRGPFLFVDYWANALGLEGGVREAHVRAGWVDPRLFRAGIDRPELELPRLRYYFFLYLLGPLLLPFRMFRRLGRYPIRLRQRVGEWILEALQAYRLILEPLGDGRVRVVAAGSPGTVLADAVLDPRRLAGFSSLFFATYKLPLASLTAILAVGIAAPLVSAAGSLELLLRYWIPVGFPALVLFLYLVYRDWVTALFGGAPVLIGRYLVTALSPSTALGWGPFFAALAGLFAVYLIADWFFAPRPVPPTLLLYTADEPGRPYERAGDEPYWLEGKTYWVWRYLLLAPAQLNRFWERDWERLELWIRADGPEAGGLEWVVTDSHYREVWIPYRKLGGGEALARHRAEALAHAAQGRPGLWLAEVDANLVFHTPWVRTVSFLPEGRDIPVRSVWHLLRAALLRGRRDDPDDYLPTLETLRVERGQGVLSDLPEAVVSLAARHILATPWRYWRYPLGAQRRRQPRLYEADTVAEPPLAADPELQIKAPPRARTSESRRGRREESRRDLP